MDHLKINNFNALGSGGIDFVSNQDKNSFASALHTYTGRSRENASHYSTKLNQDLLAQAKKNTEEINEAALKQIASYVVTQKNKMLMESRANSFKKAAELTKEISF